MLQAYLEYLILLLHTTIYLAPSYYYTCVLILIYAAGAAVLAEREPLEIKLTTENTPTPRHDGELSLASPLEVTVACAGAGGDRAVKEVNLAWY